MQSFIITLLVCSVTMSVLALLYMAITPLLAKRYSVASRYYIWLVIVIGLIIPFRPQFSNVIVKVDIPSSTVVPNIQVGNGTPVIAPLENVLPSALSTISWWQIAATVWLVGMIIFLAYHIIKHYHFLKLVAHWSKDITDEQTLTLIQDLKSQMGLSKNINLQVCDSIASPMMIGFVRPRILLPKTDFAKDELCFILKHELVHYKRKDLWYKCLVLIATAIHWFNPIVYLMAKAIDIQCELSCDEKVVHGTNADIRLYYSKTIIGVVRYQSKLKTSLSTNFYGGKKGMKKRICSILDMSKKKVGVAVLCTALLLTLGTGVVFATSALSPNGTVQKSQTGQQNSVGVMDKQVKDLVVYNTVEVRHYTDGGAPYVFWSRTNNTDKTITNIQFTMLAFDENGKPLNLPWNVMDSSAGYSYDGFCDWEPVNLKPHLTADSNNGSEEGGWSLGWSMSNDDKELQKLFSKVAYILCYDKQITFDDGEVWNNPDYDKWLATYLGNEVDVAVLKNYYAK